MTTIELLVHCRSRGPKLRIPDLLWQRHMHLEENLKVLYPSPLFDNAEER